MPSLLSLNSYHYRRGGADVVYLEHAKMFEDAGWDASYFSMHHPRNLPCKDSKYFTRLVDWEFTDRSHSKLHAAINSVYNRDARKNLRKLLSEHRPDIAHAHSIYHHLTPAILPVLSDQSIPVILTAHDLKLACPAYKMMNSNGICERCKTGGLWNVITNRCIKDSLAASTVVGIEAYLHAMLGSYDKHLTKIVTPSQFYRNKLIEWGWHPDKLEHIPNFVPPADLRQAGHYDGSILYFGRLSSEKGLATLLRASALSGVPIDIAGDGPQEQELQELASELSAPVNFLGRLDGDALWGRVGSARAVVLPSEWYENAPMSALEAMQLFRPVIGADIGGIPEIITPSGAGVLFASGDEMSLANRLAEIASMSEGHLRDLGEKAARHVSREFSRDLYFSRMNDLYARSLI